MITSSKMKIISIISLAFILIFVSGCENKYENLDLSMYQYRDTKNLVRFVYNAAQRLRRDGLKSLEYFKKHRDKYKTNDYYLYIYDTDGTNLFHAGMKELEGKNLWDITDIKGKKITHLILNAINDKNNSHGWVHYTWWEPGKFYPVPKSSCNFKVITPEGKEIFVGGGINYPHEEREFIRIIVDDAAELINRKGKDALQKISDPTSEYNYRDVRVFVFRSDGKPLISPVVNENFLDMNLLECVDEIGHKPFAMALEKLKSKDAVWEVFMAKNRYQRVLVKKCMFIRKATMDGEKVFVGAITDLPQPPWTG